jgi:F-type H+-transporting ATPase subunit b
VAEQGFPALRSGSSAAAPPTSDIATAPLPPFESPESSAHGAGHEGPLIENWWSWDYGPGPGHTHRNPPFGFALINFAVFLLILSRLFGQSFRDFLRERHGEVRRAIDRAEEAQHHAEKHLKQIEDRAKSLEAEIASLVASYRKLAESERQAIVQRAEAEAANLIKDAEAQAQAAIAAARRTLEQKTALLAVDLAEKLLRSHLRDDDYRRLDEKYVTEIEALGRTAAAARNPTLAPGKESPR